MKKKYINPRSHASYAGKQLLSILIFLCICCLFTGLYGILKNNALPFSAHILSSQPESTDDAGQTEYAADTETVVSVHTASHTAQNSGDTPMSPLPGKTGAESRVEHETRDSSVPIRTLLLPPEDYDYSSPVPATEEAVDDTYFADAVFLGDSRMEGFAMQCGLSNITCYAYKGLTTESVFTSEVIYVNGEKTTAIDALRASSFSKVYIMLGINETGWANPKAFPEYYGKVVDAVREIREDAVVYVMSILPVSKTVSETHEYVTNEKITLYNDYLREMCREKEAFYLDLSFLAGEDGALPEDAARDGIHVGWDCCQQWMEYLRTHTVPMRTITDIGTENLCETDSEDTTI